MKADVLLGLQWGDEGKGKIVDYLSPKYNIIARFQGGPNAGHTLEFDNIKHVLHQIPSGIFRPGIKNVIGNGVIIDPIIFKKEIEGLANFNVNAVENLMISDRTQLILPTHKSLDAAQEKSKGDDKIGSTLKGIGPTYQDKIGRMGLRMGDLITPGFKDKYTFLKNHHLSILKRYNYHHIDNDDEFFAAVDFLKKFDIAHTSYFLNNSMSEGQTVLAEGAQGSLLDIDFGSYPFVTSSNTTVSGACSGLGLPPASIGKVFGIFKAYCTRVGSGPFPTELFDNTGERLRKCGHEFGATTGRPRRCGWLDLPALNYSIMINGVTNLFMMKADVLSEFEEVKVCTAYKMKDGTVSEVFPYSVENQIDEPVYKTFTGWKGDISAVHSIDSIPEELLNFVSFIEENTHVPISILSVGPDREQTIIREKILV